jgi:5-methylcytosine-specific restriction endonuclease McrA
MAQAAVKSGEAKYGRLHFIIRSKLYQGLMTNTMNIGSIYDDERIKMIMPNSCSYCGSLDSLSLDHIISRKNGGSEVATI